MQSEPHNLYRTYWSLWSELSRRKYFLVICELLGVFVKILTYDDKYSLLNRDNVRQPIQMQLSQKQETFSELISPFFKARLNIEHFQKNMLPIADVFPKLRTPKKEVNQISKTSRFRELFPKQNVRWTKHCWNLNHTTFITFIAHCESNCVGKNISYWYAKSLQKLFLTYWQAMTSILFLIETI